MALWLALTKRMQWVWYCTTGQFVIFLLLWCLHIKQPSLTSWRIKYTYGEKKVQQTASTNHQIHVWDHVGPFSPCQAAKWLQQNEWPQVRPAEELLSWAQLKLLTHKLWANKMFFLSSHQILEWFVRDNWYSDRRQNTSYLWGRVNVDWKWACESLLGG